MKNTKVYVDFITEKLKKLLSIDRDRKSVV